MTYKNIGADQLPPAPRDGVVEDQAAKRIDESQFRPCNTRRIRILSEMIRRDHQIESDLIRRDQDHVESEGIKRNKEGSVVTGGCHNYTLVAGSCRQFTKEHF